MGVEVGLLGPVELRLDGRPVPGAYGLGTQGGPAKRLRLLAEAGFDHPVVAADTGFTLVLAATRP